MTELLTSAQMRAIEAAAIESGEATGLELMERAGKGVVEAIFEEWPELAKSSHRAVVLCGPGNNGGDGFVVARLLKEWGWEVEVFHYGDPEKLPPDAKANCRRWGRIGRVSRLEDFETPPIAGNVAALGPTADSDALIVDAVFGTGASRPAVGPLADLLHQVRRIADCGRSRVVAVDIPSGLCSDSGRALGEAAGANLTVAFHRAKLGHFLSDGGLRCGRVKVASIGLGTRKDEGLPGEIPSDVAQLARPQRVDKAPRSHKYAHGHALILSGGSGKGGAARLAARGALRIGAGLVTVGCPSDALAENATQLNAIMLNPVHDADALAHLLEDARINALGLGPALGTGEREAALVAAALGAKRATVLDADALTLISREKALFHALHEDCVLTPHAGEFASLFPDIAKELNRPATKGPAYSKVDATREAAARAGCVVHFKGPDTVIADPTGRCVINSAHYDRAAPWLATAGSGDVLAGMIAGLLARGFGPMQAAETAAWLHVECALSFGPGLIAEDLPDELPKVFQARSDARRFDAGLDRRRSNR